MPRRRPSGRVAYSEASLAIVLGNLLEHLRQCALLLHVEAEARNFPQAGGISHRGALLPSPCDELAQDGSNGAHLVLIFALMFTSVDMRPDSARAEFSKVPAELHISALDRVRILERGSMVNDLARKLGDLWMHPVLIGQALEAVCENLSSSGAQSFGERARSFASLDTDTLLNHLQNARQTDVLNLCNRFRDVSCGWLESLEVIAEALALSVVVAVTQLVETRQAPRKLLSQVVAA